MLQLRPPSFRIRTSQFPDIVDYWPTFVSLPTSHHPLSGQKQEPRFSNKFLSMSVVLNKTLEELCSSKGWNYAVFWRAKLRNKTILMWEDACTNFSHPSNDLLCEQTEVDYQSIAMAVSKMTYHIYSAGEGLVGRAAASGKHQWIFSPTLDKDPALCRNKLLLYCKYPSGWQQQFESGIKTIALISVPGGVVQLGSVNFIPEDEKFILYAKSLFTTLQNIPGAFLSDLVQETPVKPCFGMINSQPAQPMESQPLPPRISLSEISKRPSARQLLATTAAQHISRQFQQESRKRQFTFPLSGPQDCYSMADLSQSRSSLVHSSQSRATLPVTPTQYQSRSIHQMERIAPVMQSQFQGLNNDMLRNSHQPNPQNIYSQMGRSFSHDPWLRKHGLVEEFSNCESSIHDAAAPTLSSCKPVYPPSPNNENSGLLGDVVAGSVRKVAKVAPSSQPWEAFMSNSSNQAAPVVPMAPVFQGKSYFCSGVPPGRSNIRNPLLEQHAEVNLAELEKQATQEVLRSSGLFPAMGGGLADQFSQQSNLETQAETPFGGDPLLLSECYNSNTEYEQDVCQAGRPASEKFIFGEAQSTEKGPSDGNSSELPPAKKKRPRKKETGGPKQRPRDRQLIQDRLKDLRGIIPYTQKCSIDNLLEKTMRHLQFTENSLAQRANFEQVETWLGVTNNEPSNPSPLPFSVKNIPFFPNHFAVQVCCHSEAIPLQVLDNLSKLGLAVRRSKLQKKNGKLWGYCIVQFIRPIQKSQIMWALMSALNLQTFAPREGHTAWVSLPPLHQQGPVSCAPCPGLC